MEARNSIKYSVKVKFKQSLSVTICSTLHNNNNNNQYVRIHNDNEGGMVLILRGIALECNLKHNGKVGLALALQ